jgi:hypothetical protein
MCELYKTSIILKQNDFIKINTLLNFQKGFCNMYKENEVIKKYRSSFINRYYCIIKIINGKSGPYIKGKLYDNKGKEINKISGHKYFIQNFYFNDIKGNNYLCDIIPRAEDFKYFELSSIDFKENDWNRYCNLFGCDSSSKNIIIPFDPSLIVYS